MQYGTILKELRESSRCSLTQKQASILLQVTLASIQNWESGRKRVRKLATLHKMLELYGAGDADRLRAIVMMFGTERDQESLEKILNTQHREDERWVISIYSLTKIRNSAMHSTR